VQVNDVIGMAGRAITSTSCSTSTTRWATRPAWPAANACRLPHGALMPATVVDENNVFAAKADREVAQRLPYCGVGCQLTYHVKDDKLLTSAAATARRTRTGCA